MDDNKLYEGILGLETPWHVVEVELDRAGGEVRIHIENDAKRLPCPVCEAPSLRHDEKHRRWRHLDTCQLQTILIAAVPRTKCQRHGVKQVTVPWADRGSRFTALFESLVISWLQTANVSAVAALFGLSWSAVDRIMRSAVRPGLKRQRSRLPRHLGVDETSFQKRHEYVTVVCDQESGDVVHVADGRSGAALEEYLARFDEPTRARVETVAMDMWQAYITAVERHIPGAENKLCFDKFHVAQHLGNAVDRVRREEHRRLLHDGNDALTGSRFVWLASAEKSGLEDSDAFDRLRKIAVKTARAWAIKEAGIAAWRYRSRRWARDTLLQWYSWAIRSRLDPIRRVARMVKRHLQGIVNAIVHRVTNARAEGINSRIQWIKYTARGFRNRNRFRRAILFHLGGLNMLPETLAPIDFHTT